MTIEVRAIQPDEVEAFGTCVFEVFGTTPDADPSLHGRLAALIDPTQLWGAFDGRQLVATAGTFELEIGIPRGRSIPIAGLTLVTVRPTHRRRGVLRSLMNTHLDDARARGRAISGLWASEAQIYGRFGYGVATWCDDFEIAHAHHLTITTDGAFDETVGLDAAAAAAELPAIYARATAPRPGALRRTDLWWRHRRFLETPWHRKDASTLRHVAARRGDQLVGYLAYRQRGGFTDGLPSGALAITELCGCDPQAEATLWRYALAVDLFPKVSWWNAPADDPLPWLVDDTRRVKRHRSDGLWLRIEDVAAGLTARDYAADGRVQLGVDGQTWELTIEDGRARCVASTLPASVELDRATLAALYLGGTPASALARASRVRGDAGAIATLDRCFASAVAPWCPEVF